MSIQIKNEDVLFGLQEKRHDPILCRVIRWWVRTFDGIMITESWRPKKHDNDLHGVIPVRANDVRSHDFAEPELAAEECNRNWQYDPKRPDMQVCVFHAVCPTCGTRHSPPYRIKCDKCGADITYNWHFHIQTHPNTVRVG